MNSNFMHHIFVPFLRKQVDIHAQKGRAMIVMDSCGSHLCNSVVNTMKSLDLIPVTIRGGFTSYLQAIDTHWTSAYRTVHQQLYDNTTPVMIKRTAAQKRSLLAHLVAEADIRTHKIVDVRQAFVDCGYISPHLAKIRIHLSDSELPYKFVDPDLNADERAADVKRQDHRSVKHAQRKRPPTAHPHSQLGQAARRPSPRSPHPPSLRRSIYLLSPMDQRGTSCPQYLPRRRQQKRPLPLQHRRHQGTRRQPFTARGRMPFSWPRTSGSLVR